MIAKTLFISIYFLLILSLVSGQVIIGSNAINNKGVSILNPNLITITSGGSGNVTGLDSGTANSTYLKLDATNSPVTGSLNISFNGVTATPTLSVSALDSAWWFLPNYLSTYNIQLCVGVKPCILGSGTEYWSYNRNGTMTWAGTLVGVSMQISDLGLTGNALGGGYSFLGLNRIEGYYLNTTYLNSTLINTINFSSNNATIRQLNSFFRNDCPAGNYSIGTHINGSSKCRTATDLDTATNITNNYYYYSNQTVIQTFTTQYNTTIGGYFQATASAMNGTSGLYLPFFSSAVGVSPSQTNKLFNISQASMFSNLKVYKNSISNDMNFSFVIGNALSTRIITCSTPLGQTSYCENSTTQVFAKAGEGIQMWVRAQNGTPITNIAFSIEMTRNTTTSISFNVSSPTFAGLINNDNSQSLDTIYQNTRNETILIYASVLSTVNAASDQAYATAFVGANPPVIPLSIAGISKYNQDVQLVIYDNLVYSVKPYENWTITSTIAGNGSLGLVYWTEMIMR